ncbi:Uncharacterised protein [Klebsiella pneumoniae]|nr:Uncharacterised protein [Klebsiella pneumoniae]
MIPKSLLSINPDETFSLTIDLTYCFYGALEKIDVLWINSIQFAMTMLKTSDEIGVDFIMPDDVKIG